MNKNSAFLLGFISGLGTLLLILSVISLLGGFEPEAPREPSEAQQMTDSREKCIENGSYFYAWADPQGNLEFICTRNEEDLAVFRQMVETEWWEYYSPAP